MTIWQDDYVLVLNGNEVNTPGTVGDQITLAIAGVSPMVRLLGEVQQGGNGQLFGRVDKQIELRVTCKPFSVKANTDSRVQSYGTLWRLIYHVLPHTYVHVRGAYSSLGSSVGLPESTLPRAVISGDVTASDPAYSDLFWQSHLPMTCVLDGEATPSTNFEQGWEELSFTLVKAMPE